MSHEIIFHNYPSSPFSEKVRVAFGIKGLSWRSVVQPVIMPKPDLIPLTGGYRKIPVMQIGADSIATARSSCASWSGGFRRHRSRRSSNNGARGYALGFWADRQIFNAAVAIIFGELGDMVPEAFKTRPRGDERRGLRSQRAEGGGADDAGCLSRAHGVPGRSARAMAAPSGAATSRGWPTSMPS